MKLTPFVLQVLCSHVFSPSNRENMLVPLAGSGPLMNDWTSSLWSVSKSSLKSCSRLRIFKSNQIKSLLLSHHHSTSALVSEILMSVLQTVQKNNNDLHMDRQCKKTNNLQMDRQCKKKQQTIYIWTDSAKKQQTIYIWTDSAKKQQQFTYGQTVQKKTTNNLHMDRQCKKTTAIYIWTVHIYRLYRRQCAKYTYIYSVHIVYYKDTLNYQRHIIHRMGTSTLCTVSVHNVVHT